MHRLGTCHPLNSVMEAQSPAENHSRVDSAYSAEPQESLISDIRHHKAYFVHVRREHYAVFRGLSALFKHQQVPEIIHRHLVGDDVRHDIVTHRALVPGGSVQGAYFQQSFSKISH